MNKILILRLFGGKDRSFIEEKLFSFWLLISLIFNFLVCFFCFWVFFGISLVIFIFEFFVSLISNWLFINVFYLIVLVVKVMFNLYFFIFYC